MSAETEVLLRQYMSQFWLDTQRQVANEMAADMFRKMHAKVPLIKYGRRKRKYRCIEARIRQTPVFTNQVYRFH